MAQLHLGILSSPKPRLLRKPTPESADMSWFLKSGWSSPGPVCRKSRPSPESYKCERILFYCLQTLPYGHIKSAPSDCARPILCIQANNKPPEHNNCMWTLLLIILLQFGRFSFCQTCGEDIGKSVENGDRWQTTHSTPNSSTPANPDPVLRGRSPPPSS